MKMKWSADVIKGVSRLGHFKRIGSLTVRRRGVRSILEGNALKFAKSFGCEVGEGIEVHAGVCKGGDCLNESRRRDRELFCGEGNIGLSSHDGL